MPCTTNYLPSLLVDKNNNFMSPMDIKLASLLFIYKEGQHLEQATWTLKFDQMRQHQQACWLATKEQVVHWTNEGPSIGRPPHALPQVTWTWKVDQRRWPARRGTWCRLRDGSRGTSSSSRSGWWWRAAHLTQAGWWWWCWWHDHSLDYMLLLMDGPWLLNFGCGCKSLYM